MKEKIIEIINQQGELLNFLSRNIPANKKITRGITTRNPS